MLSMVGAAACAHARPAPPTEAHLRIPAGARGLQLFLRHLPAARPSQHPPVLFVHGASFPSGLAAAFRFSGTSWMDHLAAQGFDVWALDFLGYGHSDRYPEMQQPASAHPPLGRAPEAAQQIAAAVDFILQKQRAPRISLVAHSWGTVPTGLYASRHPARVKRIVLFGPVARRAGAPPAESPAYQFVTEEAQRSRFTGYVPSGERAVLDPQHFAVWGPAYLATDARSHTRTPPSVQVPGGPIADIADAWSGRLPYAPEKITAPVLIVRGEWETVTTDADAQWLFRALSAAPIKRDVKISRGTHVMHLEASRFQLYTEVAAFLAERDTAVPGLTSN